MIREIEPILARCHNCHQRREVEKITDDGLWCWTCAFQRGMIPPHVQNRCPHCDTSPVTMYPMLENRRWFCSVCFDVVRLDAYNVAVKA